MRVHIDPDSCFASGECVLLAPDSFELDDDAGVARARDGAGELDGDLARKIVRTCPSGAATIDDVISETIRGDL